MKGILEKLKNKSKVVSIYNDVSDTGNCWTGFISDFDDEYVLLAHVTEHGFADGFTLISVEEIINIEEGTIYEKKLQKLYELRNQKHGGLSLNNTDDLLEGILEYAEENKEFISIMLSDDDEYPITGLIEYMEEDNICINSFTSEGKENGYAYINKNVIYQVCIASLVEQNYALLFNN